VRRLGGLFSVSAGVVGAVLCVAGLVGVWAVHSDVTRRVDRLFGGADRAVEDVRGNLRRAKEQLRGTEAELETVRKREADLAARPPTERGLRRDQSRKAVEGIRPQVAEARDLLIRATEAALVANGLLDALAELSAVERLRIDTDRLKETSTQLSELTDRSTHLASLLARAAPPDRDPGPDESSRAVEAVRRPIALAEAGLAGLDDAGQTIADSRERISRWINGITVALTVVLVWIAAGQLSLMIHGCKLVRR
jgi:hypothetical protein